MAVSSAPPLPSAYSIAQLGENEGYNTIHLSSVARTRRRWWLLSGPLSPLLPQN